MVKSREEPAQMCLSMVSAPPMGGTPFGARLNCLLPSMIKMPITIGESKEHYGVTEVGGEREPFGWGEPIDVENFVAFLLSDKVKYLTGQNYIVDSGGML